MDVASEWGDEEVDEDGGGHEKEEEGDGVSGVVRESGLFVGASILK